jgi:hypothetical protein
MASDFGCALAGTYHEMQEVVEFPLLLTARQAEALSRLSNDRGMTPGQLARRAIDEFLARSLAVHGGRPHDAGGWPGLREGGT